MCHGEEEEEKKHGGGGGGRGAEKHCPRWEK